MRNTQLMLMVAVTVLAASSAVSHAQSTSASPAPASAEQQPPLKIDLDALRYRGAPDALGLKPPAATTKERLELPFGLNYSREARSLLMPLDDKSEWGVGLNLNINKSRDVELAPSGLGLQPKRAIGLVINRKF